MHVLGYPVGRLVSALPFHPKQNLILACCLGEEGRAQQVSEECGRIIAGGRSGGFDDQCGAMIRHRSCAWPALRRKLREHRPGGDLGCLSPAREVPHGVDTFAARAMAMAAPLPSWSACVAPSCSLIPCIESRSCARAIATHPERRSAPVIPTAITARWRSSGPMKHQGRIGKEVRRRPFSLTTTPSSPQNGFLRGTDRKKHEVRLSVLALLGLIWHKCYDVA